MRPPKKQRGFTLIELVMVMTLVSILAAAAIPLYYSWTLNARRSSRDAVVGAIRSAIDIRGAGNLAANRVISYPATLDSAVEGNCDQANPCFGDVLQTPVTDATNLIGWHRTFLGWYFIDQAGLLCSYFYFVTTGVFQGSVADGSGTCP